MHAVFMGCGTSQGVPLIAHPNLDLDLKDTRNWRTRSSLHVWMGENRIQIDAAPEFRLQCLRENIDRIDLFILTHGHADHLMGMDDLRRFCEITGEPMPVYGTPEDGLPSVKRVFGYAIKDKLDLPGYPAFRLHPMPKRLELEGGTITSTLLPHGQLQVIGLVFEEKHTGSKLAYYVDCHHVPQAAIQLAEKADILIIDGLRHLPHPTHLTIQQAIDISHHIHPKKTYLTHLGTSIDYQKESTALPPDVYLAYDGLRVDCQS